MNLADADPERHSQREQRLAALGSCPPWWRFFARREWRRRRAAIMTMDVSVFAAMLARLYQADGVIVMASRPNPMSALTKAGRQ